MKTLLAAILALLPVIGAAQENARPSEDWTAINLSVTDYHVIPRYQALADSAGRLNRLARDFCAAPSADALQGLRGGYHEAMDAWQGIQHVQFGPVTYFNWNYRLQFWPDERGTGARQLSALIAGEDAEQLESDNFAQQSVGVQGFPALEQLLFEDDALARLDENAFRCRVMQAIAANIDEMAAGVHQRWVEEFRDTVADAEQRGFFESPRDATVDFLKSLVETLPRLRDQKLALPLGNGFESARARRAESWYAERSLRNIKLNVAALEEMFQGAGDADPVLASVFHGEDVETVSRHFAALHESLTGLPEAMAPALQDEEQYRLVVRVQEEVDALYEALEAALKNTDLYLGFNSLDGD